ncbi:hypothetical protein FRB96_000123 [Tulasnella sp. 330]|nr:hypothetical protein FRB96_000123 [Tulasnella sp. 330]
MSRLLASVTFFFALAAGSPLTNDGKSAVIPIPARALLRRSDGVFDAELALQDVGRVKAKYAALQNQSTTGAPLNRRSSGSDSLTDNYQGGMDVSYYGALSVGTPAQMQNIDFDTGSSDLVIPLVGCTGSCMAPLFNYTESSTYRSTTEMFSLIYEDGGGVDGLVAVDKVSFAGLTVQKQGFGAISSESGNFGGPYSGLLGLGFPAKSTPFFINLCKQGVLDKWSQLFAFYLSRAGAKGSELSIGRIDTSKYTGHINYYPLDSASTGHTQLYWNVLSEGFSYGNGKPTGAFSAVFDTGSTLIFIPTAAAEALYGQIQGAMNDTIHGPGFYTFPCSSKPAPTLVLKNGNGVEKYAINPLDFNLGKVTAGSSQCVGAIIGESLMMTLIVLAADVVLNRAGYKHKSSARVYNYGTGQQEMRATFLLTILFAIFTFALAWSKEDYEIFDLVGAIEAAEGPGTTFYSWLEVSPKATSNDINRAYRKKSLTLHPDKNPNVKGIQQRYARLGVVAAILRDAERRERYDFFFKNGVPKWRGTGYYYSRYRPGLISVLLFLLILTSGMQYIIQKYNYWMDTRRIERFVKKARKLAWGPEMKPQPGAKKVRLLLTERPGDDRTVEMRVDGENVYLLGEGDPVLLNEHVATKPALMNTWAIAITRNLIVKWRRPAEATKDASADEGEEEDTDDAAEGDRTSTSSGREATGMAGVKRRKGALKKKTS